MNLMPQSHAQYAPPFMYLLLLIIFFIKFGNESSATSEGNSNTLQPCTISKQDSWRLQYTTAKAVSFTKVINYLKVNNSEIVVQVALKVSQVFPIHCNLFACNSIKIPPLDFEQSG